MSMEDHVDELKSRSSAASTYSEAMEYPLSQVEDIMGSLVNDGSGREVVVMKYATGEDVKVLTNLLTRYEPRFDVKYRSMSQLKNMPWIEKFLHSEEHCRKTAFTLEYQLCGVRTPDVDVGGYNLRAEVPRWMDLPVPNPSDKDHYLSATEAWSYIDKKNISLETLKKFIPTVKGDSAEQNALSMPNHLEGEKF
ncbi:hypothetical protein ACHAXR_004151 [Thalassiosira sp. AJA248-18]